MPPGKDVRHLKTDIMSIARVLGPGIAQDPQSFSCSNRPARPFLYAKPFVVKTDRSVSKQLLGESRGPPVQSGLATSVREARVKRFHSCSTAST